MDKMMSESFQGNQMESMDDEVAEDTSGSASFMVGDEVSNVVDVSDTEMRGNFASVPSFV